jgi:hypothetical protein
VRGEYNMEMRKNNVKQFEEKNEDKKQTINKNFIDDVLEVYDFLHYDCYSVPDISINGELKHSTNLAWIRRNIDIDLNNISNYKFEYINDTKKILEIKYLNDNVIKLFAD